MFFIEHFGNESVCNIAALLTPFCQDAVDFGCGCFERAGEVPAVFYGRKSDIAHARIVGRRLRESLYRVLIADFVLKLCRGFLKVT